MDELSFFNFDKNPFLLNITDIHKNYLAIEFVIRNVAFDKIIGSPLDCIKQIFKLPCTFVTILVGDTSPC